MWASYSMVCGVHVKFSIEIQLMHGTELLARMVCLGVGPGIAVAKIDEAIQSTLMAAF